MKRIIRNIADSLTGRTQKHYCAYYLCILLGIVAVATGLCTSTVHNVLFGAMFLIFGRVYLTADYDPESPYEV